MNIGENAINDVLIVHLNFYCDPNENRRAVRRFNSFFPFVLLFHFYFCLVLFFLLFKNLFLLLFLSELFVTVFFSLPSYFFFLFFLLFFFPLFPSISFDLFLPFIYFSVFLFILSFFLFYFSFLLFLHHLSLSFSLFIIIVLVFLFPPFLCLLSLPNNLYNYFSGIRRSNLINSMTIHQSLLQRALVDYWVQVMESKLLHNVDEFETFCVSMGILAYNQQ